MKTLINTLFKRNNNEDRYEGEVVDLVKRYFLSEDNAYDGVPTVYYDIYLHGTNHKVGKCDLRLKLDERMYYYGHVGYNILPSERGHNYSYYACKILFKIAKELYSFNEIYITCDPDNEASYKILKKLNGELVEVTDIPKGHELYRKGMRYKCVFRYKVNL